MSYTRCQMHDAWMPEKEFRTLDPRLSEDKK